MQKVEVSSLTQTGKAACFVCATSSVTWPTKMVLALGGTVISQQNPCKDMMVTVPTRVTSTIRERVCLSRRVSPVPLCTVNSLSSMSGIIQSYWSTITIHLDVGCHVIMIRWRAGEEPLKMANAQQGWARHMQSRSMAVIVMKTTTNGEKTAVSSLKRKSFRSSS